MSKKKSASTAAAAAPALRVVPSIPALPLELSSAPIDLRAELAGMLDSEAETFVSGDVSLADYQRFDDMTQWDVEALSAALDAATHANFAAKDLGVMCDFDQLLWLSRLGFLTVVCHLNAAGIDNLRELVRCLNARVPNRQQHGEMQAIREKLALPIPASAAS